MRLTRSFGAPRWRLLAVAAITVLSVVSAAQARGGDLDETFGAGGWVSTDFGSSNDAAWRLAIQPDGRLVAAGWTDGGSSLDFAVARYSVDGTLDPSFGSGGKVATDIGVASYDQGMGVAVQDDGKVLVAGLTREPPEFNLDLAVVRHLPDGSLDPGFGIGGKVVTDCLLSCVFADLGIQPDGKIVVAGNTFISGPEFMAVRYMADGSLDPSFGADGVATVNLAGSARALALQADGKIIVVGESSGHFALARFTSFGSPDNSFGAGGVVASDVGAFPLDGRDVAIQPDGRIVVAGVRGDTSPDQDVAVARYLSDGNIDASFGSGGLALTDVLGSADEGNAVTIQPDGKLVVVGSASGAGGGVAFLRYSPDGTLDPTFGGNGKAIFNPYSQYASGVILTDVKVQADNRIVAAGRSGAGDFALVRLVGAATAQEQLTDLIGIVDNLSNQKLGRSLHDKLATVQRMLDSSKTTQACENLEAFISQVDSQAGKGLTTDQATDIRTRANALKNTIGC